MVPYFVNKRTGEARWRASAAGVEATAGAIAEACDQCKRAAAERRCLDCSESYCVPCYGEYHAKGARSKHTFKAVKPAESDALVPWREGQLRV